MSTILHLLYVDYLTAAIPSPPGKDRTDVTLALGVKTAEALSYSPAFGDAVRWRIHAPWGPEHPGVWGERVIESRLVREDLTLRLERQRAARVIQGAWRRWRAYLHDARRLLWVMRHVAPNAGNDVAAGVMRCLR